VRDQAEQREEQRREQWDQQVAWLKDEIATAAESCKQHNRAIDLEWEAVHNSTTPQQAHEAMMAVCQHCEQVPVQCRAGIARPTARDRPAMKTSM
jgi:hypothetical protein